MVDPVSGAVLAGVALTEGIKFLYAQAGKILDRRAERKRAQKEGQPPAAAPIEVETPDVVAGELKPFEVDDAETDRLFAEIVELRHRLEPFAEHEESPQGHQAVLGPVLAL